MQRQKPEGSQFFSMQAAKDLDFQVNQQLLRYLKEGKETGMSKEYDSTSNTQIISQKTQIKYEQPPNGKVDDSCFEDFQDFIKKMPKQNDQPFSNISMSSEFSITKEKRVQITPSYLKQKEKYVAQSNWLNELQLRCIIEYNNNKKVKTVCKIKDAQMQFENGGCSFRLTKITKIKVLFQSYQKCICFTYDQVKGKKNVQIKFKIFVENDLKDDLYILFSKVIIQKLILLDCQVDLKSKDDPNADKFMMSGEIYKLSQVMHHWKLRKIILTDRIESYKGDKCTFQMKNIKQMWTRFQLYQKCLVIKLRHGKQKTQLALPIVNYPARFCTNNWLYRIYRLLTSAL